MTDFNALNKMVNQLEGGIDRKSVGLDDRTKPAIAETPNVDRILEQSQAPVEELPTAAKFGPNLAHLNTLVTMEELQSNLDAEFSRRQSLPKMEASAAWKEAFEETMGLYGSGEAELINADPFIQQGIIAEAEPMSGFETLEVLGNQLAVLGGASIFAAGGGALLGVTGVADIMWAVGDMQERYAHKRGVVKTVSPDDEDRSILTGDPFLDANELWAGPEEQYSGGTAFDRGMMHMGHLNQVIGATGAGADLLAITSSLGHVGGVILRNNVFDTLTSKPFVEALELDIERATRVPSLWNATSLTPNADEVLNTLVTLRDQGTVFGVLNYMAKSPDARRLLVPHLKETMYEIANKSFAYLTDMPGGLSVKDIDPLIKPVMGKLAKARGGVDPKRVKNLNNFINEMERALANDNELVQFSYKYSPLYAREMNTAFADFVMQHGISKTTKHPTGGFETIWRLPDGPAQVVSFGTPDGARGIILSDMNMKGLYEDYAISEAYDAAEIFGEVPTEIDPSLSGRGGPMVAVQESIPGIQQRDKELLDIGLDVRDPEGVFDAGLDPIEEFAGIQGRLKWPTDPEGNVLRVNNLTRNQRVRMMEEINARPELKSMLESRSDYMFGSNISQRHVPDTADLELEAIRRLAIANMSESARMPGDPRIDHAKLQDILETTEGVRGDVVEFDREGRIFRPLEQQGISQEERIDTFGRIHEELRSPTIIQPKRVGRLPNGGMEVYAGDIVKGDYDIVFFGGGSQAKTSNYIVPRGTVGERIQGESGYFGRDVQQQLSQFTKNLRAVGVDAKIVKSGKKNTYPNYGTLMVNEKFTTELGSRIGIIQTSRGNFDPANKAIIESSLQNLADYARKNPDAKIGMPLVGAGKGGLDETEALKLINDANLPENVKLVVTDDVATKYFDYNTAEPIIHRNETQLSRGIAEASVTAKVKPREYTEIFNDWLTLRMGLIEGRGDRGAILKRLKELSDELKLTPPSGTLFDVGGATGRALHMLATYSIIRGVDQMDDLVKMVGEWSRPHFRRIFADLENHPDYSRVLKMNRAHDLYNKLISENEIQHAYQASNFYEYANPAYRATFDRYVRKWDDIIGTSATVATKGIQTPKVVRQKDLDKLGEVQDLFEAMIQEAYRPIDDYPVGGLDDVTEAKASFHRAKTMGEAMSVSLYKRFEELGIPKKDQAKIVGLIETGEGGLPPIQRELASMIDNFYARIGEVFKGEGMLRDLVPNYFTKMYNKDMGAERMGQIALGTTQFSPFMLQRQLNDIMALEGIPRETDIRKVMATYYSSMMEAKAGRWLGQRMLDIEVPLNETEPDAFVPLLQTTPESPGREYVSASSIFPSGVAVPNWLHVPDKLHRAIRGSTVTIGGLPSDMKATAEGLRNVASNVGDGTRAYFVLEPGGPTGTDQFVRKYRQRGARSQAHPLVFAYDPKKFPDTDILHQRLNNQMQKHGFKPVGTPTTGEVPVRHRFFQRGDEVFEVRVQTAGQVASSEFMLDLLKPIDDVQFGKLQKLMPGETQFGPYRLTRGRPYWVHKDGVKLIRSLIQSPHLPQSNTKLAKLVRGSYKAKLVGKSAIMLNPMVHGVNALFNATTTFSPLRPVATQPLPFTPGGLWSKGRKLLKDPEAMADAIRHGVNSDAIFSASSEIHDSVAKAMDEIYGGLFQGRKTTGRGAVGLFLAGGDVVSRAFKKSGHKLLWDHLQAIMMGAWDTEWRNIAKSRKAMVDGVAMPIPEEMAKRIAAEEINTRFGMLPEHWKSNGERVITSWALFAKNWTPSNIKQFIGMLPSKTGAKASNYLFNESMFGHKEIPTEYRDALSARYRKFWAVGMMNAMAANFALQYVMTGTLPSENEGDWFDEGRKWDIRFPGRTTKGGIIYSAPWMGRTHRDLIGLMIDIKNLEPQNFGRKKVDPFLRVMVDLFSNRDSFTGEEILHDLMTPAERATIAFTHFAAAFLPTSLIDPITGKSLRTGRVLTPTERVVTILGSWYRTGMQLSTTSYNSMPKKWKKAFHDDMNNEDRAAFREAMAEGVFTGEIGWKLKDFVDRADLEREVYDEKFDELTQQYQLAEEKYEDTLDIKHYQERERLYRDIINLMAEYQLTTSPRESLLGKAWYQMKPHNFGGDR